MVADKVNGRDMKYDMEGTGVGPRTEARIEASELMLPTRCRVERPPRP